MTRKRTNYMHRSDTLFSKLIRDRDGRCQANGFDTVTCAGNLQCAHIHSRSYKSIRTTFDNAVALCQAHHVFYTHRPLEWNLFVEKRWPGRWEALMVQALRYERVDWKLRLETLKAMADSLGVT